MASNVSVVVTADVASLNSQFAVAKAQAAALSAEFNKLAKQAASTDSFDAMKSQFDAAATSMLEAENAANQLGASLRLSSEDHKIHLRSRYASKMNAAIPARYKMN